MSTSTIWILHCDHGDCTAQAPSPTGHTTPHGWTNAGNTHGCPDHWAAITAHKANVTSQTRGRGSSEKTTWYLTCACSWEPTPNRAVHSASSLREQHLKHVEEMTRTPASRGHTCPDHPGPLGDARGHVCRLRPRAQA